MLLRQQKLAPGLKGSTQRYAAIDGSKHAVSMVRFSSSCQGKQIKGGRRRTARLERWEISSRYRSLTATFHEKIDINNLNRFIVATLLCRLTNLHLNWTFFCSFFAINPVSFSSSWATLPRFQWSVLVPQQSKRWPRLFSISSHISGFNLELPKHQQTET